MPLAKDPYRQPHCGERSEELLGAVALALDFQTWRTLARGQGLEQDRVIGLMVGMVRCLMRS